ncbi:outer membrane efflux protein [Dysgonomonas alginatilytica]|uniref:Outer membrane efflux protein n=1 Tax=Dysgonomonas alginatilytica TaxID=1605892 RepID=A0A2V3PQU6_9BACT|nr:TolC family protein [Dysgonomonas alginatilytica]PXV66764.1 outer membrane efflux protein [Dysgonomonas alginatilytica]
MLDKKYKYIIILVVMTLISTPTWGQTADSLSHYLEIAARNNPGVKSDFLAYKASLQKVPQAGAYEDPELEMGFFLQPMDIIDGRQVAEFKLMQMFPWFGTKKAAQTEATHMARMSFEKFRETRDNLFLDVYTQWFILCSLQQKLINNHENKKLLTQLEELALRKFSSPSSGSSSGYALSAPVQATSTTSTSTGGGMSSMSSMGGGAATQAATQSSSGMSSMGGSGGGSMSGSSSSGMSDVLRIQMEITELDNNIESLQSEIKAEKAKFNALLNRSADSEIIIPDSFDQIPFLFDGASAMDKITDQNPMLGMINEEGLAYKAKAEMDKKMSYPMFGIGLQYMLINKSLPTETAPMSMDMGTSNTMSSMNGKDMIMPMVSVSIPIYRNKYKAQQKESKFWWQASREKYTNTLNTLEAELYKTKHQLDDASRKIALYKKQSNLAQTTYNLVVQEFISGKSDLTNVIQVQRQLLDYQLKGAEAIANYNTMVAAIQKLISFKDIEEQK